MKVPTLTDLNVVKTNLPLVFFNCGIKGENPIPKADLYLDCRGVANPSHAGMGSGDHPAVQDYVKKHSDLVPYICMIEAALRRMTSRRGAGKEFEKPFRIVTMCAHGVHRSRAMKHILAQWAKTNGFKSVEVE